MTNIMAPLFGQNPVKRTPRYRAYEIASVECQVSDPLIGAE
jgi:hypothetical protein